MAASTLRLIPQARSIPKKTREEIVRAVCAGESAAGVVNTKYMDTTLLKRPQGCEAASLRVNVLAGAGNGLAIMSNYSSSAAADLLRKEISTMSVDGAMGASLASFTPGGGAAKPDIRIRNDMSLDSRRRSAVASPACSSWPI